MSWSKVGEWLKTNAGSGAALVGSLLTGNVAGAVAAGASMVQSATGENDATKVLERLQTDPQTVVKLKEIAAQEEQNIRKHLEEMERMRLEDLQSQHEQTQETIRTGDTSDDSYVRRTRPTMAMQSWKATIAYCIGCFGVHAIQDQAIFDLAIAGILSAPAWAYLGLRTTDKFAEAWKTRKAGS